MSRANLRHPSDKKVTAAEFSRGGRKWPFGRENGLSAVLTRLFAVVLMSAMLTQSGTAGDYEDAQAAYARNDYDEAVRILGRLAEQGESRAQAMIGIFYGNGTGLPQDYVEAARWYQLAAEQGDAVAQVNLGLAYSEGRGVSQDFGQATKWHRLAADQGLPLAQFNLATLYDSGQGLIQDYVEALKWYRLAAVQGEIRAQYNLGIKYYSGNGVRCPRGRSRCRRSKSS